MSNSTWIIVRRLLSFPFLGCGSFVLVMMAMSWLQFFENIVAGLVLMSVFGVIAAALVGVGLGLWGRRYIKIVIGLVLAAAGFQALLMAGAIGSMVAGLFGELTPPDFDDAFARRMALGAGSSAIVLLAWAAVFLIPEIRRFLRQRPPGAKPILPWFVLGWQIYSTIAVLMSVTLYLSGHTPLSPELRDYLSEHSPFGHALSLLVVVTQLVAAIYLVRLRRFAVWLFLAALIVSALWGVIGGFETPPGLPAGFMLLSAILGYSVTIAICGYSWWLLKRGVLK